MKIWVLLLVVAVFSLVQTKSTHDADFDDNLNSQVKEIVRQASILESSDTQSLRDNARELLDRVLNVTQNAIEKARDRLQDLSRNVTRRN